ncbi:MAG: amidohydrolase [Gemmatimonadaceae bacterium]|nr:amidohydrolase [Gemmatimonadaceae bacterium]
MTHTAPFLDRTELLSDVGALTAQVVSWRRHLHQRPEVAFQEHETARFIREVLAEIPGLIVSRPTETSVMARLVGARPGPTIAVRADIDALPIHEENDVPYRSQIDGAMHACGHDGHTSIVLALATLLAQHREQLPGEVRFFFQHAEELSPGGAEEMVRQGVMDGVQQVIGLHLWAPMPVGRIGIVSGPAMAAPDNFECTIIGRGGHAAIPHECVDPIVVGAQVVLALQQIVSRHIDPLDPAVLSITQFHAGTTHNVIPNTATMTGTIRTFDVALRAHIPVLMERVIKGVCEAHGAEYEYHYLPGYRPVVNDPALSARLADVVTRTFGPDVLIDTRPTMGGEDFSAYQQHAPGVFAFVGAGNTAQDIRYPHHHPRFNVDEAALDIGLRYLTAATLDLLGI